MNKTILAATLAPLTLALASCESAEVVESMPEAAPAQADATDESALPFTVTEQGIFNLPWGLAFAPGTDVLFITEKQGTMKFVDTKSGKLGTVSGIPEVDYGGQGGFGDVTFLPSEASSTLGNRTIYLTWVEAGEENTRGAVMGRGTLVCEEADACHVDGLQVIWKQVPKLPRRAHFSHKIAFSPDGKYLFLSSGERAHGYPAQDLEGNLGKVLRLNLDGTPADGNPFEAMGGVSRQIWIYGHRNVLGLAFDAEGKLWDLEHGPLGGDEINLVKRGVNYGWPTVSYGDNYDGSPIPRHPTRPEFQEPAIYWNPVIAPGDFIFYSGKLWPEWKGQAIAAGLGSKLLVWIGFEGEKAKELNRIEMSERIRDIVEAPDGSIYIAEDTAQGRLLRLTPN